MNSNDVRAVARSRANRRLTNLTIGTAILGVVATGTLGFVAAATSHAYGPLRRPVGIAVQLLADLEWSVRHIADRGQRLRPRPRDNRRLVA